MCLFSLLSNFNEISFVVVAISLSDKQKPDSHAKKPTPHPFTFTGVVSGVASIAASGGEVPAWLYNKN